jgi:nitrite reductase/ring-hydroxylating ferredoxin subunit
VDWIRIPLGELDAEGRAVVEADGHEIAVFRVEEQVHAFENACPHEGNPLIEGELLGPTLTCAYHGWRFDLDTGACLYGDEAARRFPAELRDGEIWIRLG